MFSLEADVIDRERWNLRQPEVPSLLKIPLDPRGEFR